MTSLVIGLSWRRTMGLRGRQGAALLLGGAHVPPGCARVGGLGHPIRDRFQAASSSASRPEGRGGSVAWYAPHTIAWATPVAGVTLGTLQGRRRIHCAKGARPARPCWRPFTRRSRPSATGKPFSSGGEACSSGSTVGSIGPGDGSLELVPRDNCQWPTHGHSHGPDGSPPSPRTESCLLRYPRSSGR